MKLIVFQKCGLMAVAVASNSPNRITLSRSKIENVL